jgi:uncharacterized RDD family membrane protein YckC
MTNPYAPPQAAVEDVSEPESSTIPADRGTRLGAAIVDSFLFMGAVYFPLIVALTSIEGSGPADVGTLSRGVALGAGILALGGFALWGWFTLTFMARNGQSIAKKWLHIKVVRADGSRVSLGRLVWLRNVITWILSMIPLFGVIDALFIFGESRQCLHDRIADTIVIKA